MSGEDDGKPDVGTNYSLLKGLPKAHMGNPLFRFQKSEFNEDNTPQRIVITIMGDKGVGKTFSALGFVRSTSNKTCLAISYDNKTKRVRDEMYDKDLRIHVLNGNKYLNDAQQDQITESSAVCLNYVQQALRWAEVELRPDWVMHDCCDGLEYLCEMKMRYNHGLDMAQGFKTLTWWKERKANIRAVHRASLTAARVGVIYTVYTELENIVDQYGVTAEREGKEKVPRWIDVVMTETDIAIEIVQRYNSTLRRMTHQAIIRSNKLSKTFPEIKTGTIIDVSNGGLIPFPDVEARLELAVVEKVMRKSPEPPPKVSLPVVGVETEKTPSETDEDSLESWSG